jgi:hypothetical protein
MRCGRRVGAGRPRGAKNKRTREVEAALQEVATKFAEAAPDAFEGDGVAFLRTVYKDPRLACGSTPRRRRAGLSTRCLSATIMRVIRSIQDLTDEELAALRVEAEQREGVRRFHRLAEEPRRSTDLGSSLSSAHAVRSVSIRLLVTLTLAKVQPQVPEAR